MAPRRIGIVLIVVVASVGCVSQRAAEVAEGPGPAPTAPATSLRGDFSDPVSQAEESPPTSESEPQVMLSPIDEALGVATDPDELASLIQANRIARADQATECVQRQGFDGFVVPADDGPSAESVAASERTTEESLSQLGYGASATLRGTWLTIVNPDGFASDGVDPFEAFADTLPEEQREAFVIAQASCRAQAMAELPDPITIPTHISEEVAEVRNAAQSEPRIVEVELDWSVCMRGQGLDVASRSEAMNVVWERRRPVEEFTGQFLGTGRIPTEDDEYRFETLVAPVEEVESEVVEADLRCAFQVDEFEVRREILWAAEQDWLDANLDRVALLLSEE